MRERTRFETELVDLGLREARQALAPQPPVRESEMLAYEVQAPDAYQIRGGLYGRDKKIFEGQRKGGLILNSPKVGTEESRLSVDGPPLLVVGKELARFEDGKMGKWVADYNAFVYLFDEVLRAIGRLRDLLSTGAPELPTDMTPVQKHALRPTDDTNPTNVKKKQYRVWRDKQDEYAAAEKGRLVGGHVLAVVRSVEEMAMARRAFWRAQDNMSRSIENAKRIEKPKFQDLSVSLADLAGIVTADKVWRGATAGFGILLDWMLEARRNRREYDAKMERFINLVKDTKAIVRDDFEAFRDAGQRYWTNVELLTDSIPKRDKARDEARQAAASLGQDLAPRSETREPVLAAIRMPVLVSDAWRALAVIGPAALAKLSLVLASRSLVDRANFYYKKSRSDPFGVDDITNIVRSLNRAQSRTPVLNKDEVNEWIAMNKLWVDTFNKFNV